MKVPYKDIKEQVVGQTLIQLSHAGENWWERDPAGRIPDALPITGVIREKGHVRLLFGALYHQNPEGRAVPESADQAAVAAGHLELGIGPGGWIEVVDA